MVVALKYGGQFEVGIHCQGCSHIERDRRLQMAMGLGEYPSVQAALNELLDTGNEDDPGYFEDEIKVFPCAR